MDKLLYKELLSETLKIKKGRDADFWKGVFLHILVRLAALIPLAAIMTPHWEIAFLSPAIFVFFVLPLRFSMAEGLLAFANGEKLFSPRVLSFENYFGKLFMGLRQVLKMLLSGALILGAAVYVIHLTAVTDPFTFIRMLQQIGGGSFEAGLAVAAGVAMLLCVPMLIAEGFFCADRFFYTIKKAPYKGMGKKYFKVGFLSFLLLLPTIACVVAALFTAAPPFIQSLTQDTSGFKPAMYMLVGAVILYIPAFPVRKLLVPAEMKNEA